jgi:hypothetical protein
MVSSRELDLSVPADGVIDFLIGKAILWLPPKKSAWHGAPFPYSNGVQIVDRFTS